MLDIRGKTVGLIGLIKSRCEGYGQSLRRLGARAVVIGDTTADIVFGEPGAMFEGARARGIQVRNLSELNDVLEAGPSDAQPFLDFAVLAAAPSGRVCDALGVLDWTRFVPMRDLVPLRSLLTGLEAESGIGAPHRVCTERLLGMGARAMPGHRRRVGILSSFALSPSGEHLAIGSRSGADYDAGGTLELWEVATGRCVNISNPLRGGVGWPGRRDCIQWSSDGERLGLAYDTNFVADVAPFDGLHPRTNVVVTDGWSYPPPWCWAPDGRRLAVSGDCGGEVRGIRQGICIAEINTSRFWFGRVGAADATWFPGNIPAPMAKELRREDDEDGPEVLAPSHIAWTRDGTRIFGHSKAGHAFSMDAASGDVAWVAKVANPVAWSPDDRIFAHCLVGLVLYDAATGLPTANLPMLFGASSLHWAPCTSPSRLAMVVTDDNDVGAEAGVHIIEDGRLLCSPDVNPHHDDLDVSDARSWAWSPDGAKGACLDTAGKVHVWSVTKKPVELAAFDTPENTLGIAWGAGDVLIAVGSETLSFYEATTGKPLARGPVGPNDQEASCSADDEVAFVLDQRWSWPSRWGPAAKRKPKTAAGKKKDAAPARTKASASKKAPVVSKKR